MKWKKKMECIQYMFAVCGVRTPPSLWEHFLNNTKCSNKLCQDKIYDGIYAYERLSHSNTTVPHF